MQLEVLHTPARSEEGDRNNGRPPLLFVHGICHGAWCWQHHYLPWFAERGWNCYALSLRGHGMSEGRDQLNNFGLDDYVADVMQVINEKAIRPVLVGHSMGGGIAQLAFTRHREHFAGAVLLASMPPNWLTLREKLRLLANPRGALALARLFRQKPLTPADVRLLPFFQRRIDTRDAERVGPLLQAESSRARHDIVRLTTPAGDPELPLFVIGSRQDRIFGPSAVSRTASHYDTTAVLLNEGCHDLMLDPDWQRSALAVKNWLDKTFSDTSVPD